MNRELERVLWLGVALQIAGLLLDTLSILIGGVHAVRITVPFSAAGLLVCLAAAWHERLQRLTAEEQRTPHNAAHAASLFAMEPVRDVPFSAAHQLRQFEKFLPPLMSLALALICGGGGIWLIGTSGAATQTQGTLAAGFLGGRAFAVFLLHRILLSVSRRNGGNPARVPAIWLGLTALSACLGAAIVLADAWADIALATAGMLAAGIMALLLAVEALFLLIVFLYRSRTAGDYLPETRLGALLCDPAIWTHSLAGALDYQFGFRVSETWLYRMARRMIIPLLAAQLVLLFLSHCLVILEPHEAAVVEVMGRPVPDRILPPGFHLVMPPPWHRVRRYPVHRIQTLRAGFDHENDDHGHAGDIELWTEAHHDYEHDFLLAVRDGDVLDAAFSRDSAGAVPVNLMSISVSVDYQVNDLLQYLTVHSDPVALLRQLTARQLMLEALHADVFDILGPGQQTLARRITHRLQQQVNKLNMGLTIRQVNLHGIHPPVAVAPAFEAVIGADEIHESALLEGKSYRIRRLPAAHAGAYRQRKAAAAESQGRLIVAAAETNLFLIRTRAAAAAPAVYAMRTVLDVLEERLPHTTRHVIAAPADAEVVQIDLTEKPYAALLDAAGRLEKIDPP